MAHSHPKDRIPQIAFHTPAEVAARWRVHKSTISRLVQRQSLKALHVGSELRIPVAEVERFERFGPRMTTLKKA